jgi:hypothetical protein
MSYKLFAQIAFLLGIVIGVANTQIHSDPLWDVCGWVIALSAAALILMMAGLLDED